MLIVTTENLAGHRITDVKGQVFGVVVRSRGLAGNILAGLRSIVGGEITEYTQLLEEARRHALEVDRQSFLVRSTGDGDLEQCSQIASEHGGVPFV